MIDRRFPGFVFALLAVMGSVQVGSVRQEVQTWDEGFDLAAGYSYLRTGDYRINVEHPPLGKLLNALPLLFLNPSLPLSDPSWQQAIPVDFGTKFLYENRVPADRMLFAARCVTIACMLLFGAAVAIWTRRRFGAKVALLALCLFAFDPNLIAHGRYVTSDPFLTIFVFLACIAWIEYLRAPTRGRLWTAGLMLGLAIASKTSALFLPPVLVLLYGIHWWHGGRRVRLPEMLKELCVAVAGAVLVAALVVAAIYTPEMIATLRYPWTGGKDHPLLFQPLASQTYPQGLPYPWMVNVARRLHVPSYSFILALDINWYHALIGHPNYLLGKISQRGHWNYFPVAALVKTPTATLAMLGFAVLAGVSGFIAAVRRSMLPDFRKLPFECYALMVPPVFFFTASMVSNINIGIRHILSIYPLLFVLVAWVFVTYGPRLLRWAYLRVLVALLGGLIFESMSIYPHYLAFFNWPCGGPENGPRYLLDSNLDWGQDLKKLKAWADTQHTDRLYLCYFGNAPPAYYGIQEVGLPSDANPDAWANVIGLVAVSATPLYGVYDDPAHYAALRERKPFARIGYSIYVYDLRACGPGDPGKYENENGRIAYSGRWIVDRQFEQASAHSLTYSDEPGATFQLPFHGTEVTYVYTRAFNRGIAAVEIDGAPKGDLDLYAPETQWQASTRYAGLPDGDHRLVVRVTGRRNARARGAFVDVDQLVVREFASQ